MPTATPQDFDIDAWASGAETPTKVVPVTRDRTVRDQLATLSVRRQGLQEKLDNPDPDAAPKRRMVSSPVKEIEELDEQIQQLVDRTNESWMFVHLRPLTTRENNDIAAKHFDNETDRLLAALVTAGTISKSDDHPGWAQSSAKWERLVEVIGDAQTRMLNNALTELTFDSAVTPDFLQRVSSFLPHDKPETT